MYLAKKHEINLRKSQIDQTNEPDASVNVMTDSLKRAQREYSEARMDYSNMVRS